MPNRDELIAGLRWKKVPVLDDGFVCLVDVMGDDSAVVQAARVSYGEGTKKVSDDRTLIRYLMRHRHCYDAATEVLTEGGFVPWPELAEGAKLGIWDPELGSLYYECPLEVIRQPYRGPMYRVDHGGVDLLVTPEHRMWVRTKVWGEAVGNMVWSPFRLETASELGDRSMVRYSKLAPYLGEPWTGEGFPPHADSKALLELIGFFVGDGSAVGTRANEIDFHLKKEREIAFLHDVVARTEWKLGEFPSYDGRRKFAVYAEGIGHLFRAQFYRDKKKCLPEWALRLDRDDAAALLTGLRMSDGTQKRGAWEYATSSPVLAEQVQLVALHAGEAAHITRRHTGMFGVMFLSRMAEPVVNQGKVQTSREEYDGQVYCARTRTGILVVRRNGKIVLSGNSTPFEMAELKLLVRVPMDTWRQWVRHRTANINEYSTRYSIAIDAAQATAAGEWRAQAASNRQGSEGMLSAEVGGGLSEGEARLLAESRRVYEERLAAGVAREQARKDLPLSTYTEAYWKIDLHNLLHFLALRMDAHAQKEIRDYATAIGEQIVRPLFPVVWEAFEDYRMGAMHLTRLDIGVIGRLAASGEAAPYAEEAFLAAQDESWREMTRSRERDECRGKLVRLGLMNEA